MAASPEFKVYDESGQYIAACKHLEDAAAIVNLRGAGTKIKWGHSNCVLWHEGHELQPAGESYDFVCNLGLERMQAATGGAP